MRIAIGGLAHETNTFLPGLTEVDDFKRYLYAEGDDIYTRHRGVRDFVGGMIAASDERGIPLIPTFSTTTQPSATISASAYARLRDILLDHITAAGELDALCLSLHGAGVAEEIDDLEGTLLKEIRAVVGVEPPIIVTLDLHANMTFAMVEHATALLNCHLYPHTDCYERGYEAVELAAAILRGERHPVMHMERLPIVLPPSTTMQGPAQAINERCFAVEARPGVLDCAFVHGFPHTDIPEIYSAILVTTEADPALARDAAREVATVLWESRGQFLSTLPGAEAAVTEAVASDQWPVVIAEVSDNPGGGAPGNGTHLLRALIAADQPLTAFGFIYDPAVAVQAHEAGCGQTIRVRLGGTFDDLHGAPIEGDAYVKCLTDGQFVQTSPMGAGARVNLGPMARLVIGNVDVLVSSVRTQTLDSEVFALHGIDVSRYHIVALKSHQHFRAGFAHLAGHIIRCDSPGVTTSNLDTLPFQRVNRPVWPLDADTNWAPSGTGTTDGSA